jgi:hypothetical protein
MPVRDVIVDRMRRRFVALGVVVALGAAGWWWLRDPDAVKPAERATRAPAAAASAHERGPRGGEIGGRVVLEDDPRGTLRLEGQVVDADERGVAGATVAITANPVRTATTEADGSFAFDGLVGRPYTLIARAAQGVAGPITARLTERSDPVVLRLRPAGTLTVTVIGSDGKPASDATVELRGVDVQRAATRAGVAVFAPVVPGRYQIAAWADRTARSFQAILIGAGDAEARLRLATGAPVAGKVVDDHGAGIAGARVRHGAVSDWGHPSSAQHDGTLTGADGSFRFDALPAGSFRFTASHPERTQGTSSLVTLDGRTPRDGVVIALATGAVVRGHVVDAERRPVASARVRIAAAVADPRRMAFDPPRQAYSDAEGAFEIEGLPRKALSAVALHDLGSSQTVAVDASAGDVDDLTLMLDITGAIAGTVVDPQGEPVEGAQVTAAPVPGGGRMFGDPAQWRLRGLPDALSDAAGKFTVTGLAPGEYRVSAGTARAGNPRAFRDGATARTGDSNVRLVLQADGSVKGRVEFADGSAPDTFTVGAQQIQQPFTGTGGTFVLDGLAPATYELVVRGPSFQTRSVEVHIEGSRVTDAGTITVVRGRTVSGVVVAGGQPVPDATVFAGRLVFGNGTTSSTQPGPAGATAGAGPTLGAATKIATTDASGAFSLAGFGDGDVTIIAEHEAIGRSRALRLPSAAPALSLTLVLEKFGSLGGVLRQGGKPAEGRTAEPLGAMTRGNVVVTCQSTQTPGALYSVPAGADGAYRFDRLAPDVYKLSATLGNLITGTRFYSKAAEVAAGQHVTVDLAFDPGTVTLDAAITARTGALGVASAWLVSGALSAKTASELSLRLAAAGAGTSQRVIARAGQPARFTEVAPGAYSLCVTPFPVEVSGLAAIDYAANHGDALPTYCKPVTVPASPTQQATSIAVEIPPFIADPDAPTGPGGPGPRAPEPDGPRRTGPGAPGGRGPGSNS